MLQVDTRKQINATNNLSTLYSIQTLYQQQFNDIYKKNIAPQAMIIMNTPAHVY